MKTPSNIFDDIYQHIKASSMMQTCTGVLTDMRPAASTKEDVTIEVVPGQMGQIQLAYVNVRIYVQDIQVNGQWQMNKARLRQLEALAATVLDHQRQNMDYRFSIDSMDTSPSYEGKNEHIIKTRLFYQTCNE